MEPPPDTPPRQNFQGLWEPMASRYVTHCFGLGWESVGMATKPGKPPKSRKPTKTRDPAALAAGHALTSLRRATRSAAKRSKRQLFESERVFRLLVEGVTDYAIYLLDPEGIVTSWNAGAERIKG